MGAAVGTPVVEYRLDKGTSRFTVRAFAGGMLSAMGHNPTIAIRDFDGEVHFDPAAPAKASLRLRIRADSLEVTDDIKSSDRREIETTMKQKVLETATYPTIAFESSRVSAHPSGSGQFRAAIAGNLSLHGTTGTANLSALIFLTGETMRANGEFSILQSDYGIAPVSVAGGALKIKDELKFAFDIVARKAETARKAE